MTRATAPDDGPPMTDLAREFSRYRDHGDVAALAAVFDATVARLTSLALHLCGDPADAEDAVQATFLVAIRKAATFDAQRRVEPWLIGILEGEAANLRRTRRRRPAAPLDRAPELALACAAAGPLQANERRELVELLRTRVDRLPHDLRQVLLLQLQHGLAAAEVAEVLGLSPGAVRMRIHRGLAALRRLLPASLGAMLVGMLPTRGLAAVRATVLGAGARQAASILGGVLMKKVAATVCLALVAALAWVGIAAPWSAAPPLPTAAPPLAAAVGAVPAAEPPSTPTTDEPGAADTARVAIAAPDVAADADAPSMLHLRVVTYETGIPVAHATARLRPQRSDVDGNLLQRAVTTDAKGEARVTDLAPGDYELMVHCGTTRTVHIAAHATTEVVVDVMTGNPARGIVVFADGRPAPRAQILLDGNDSFFTCLFDGGLADAEGRFHLDAVYPFFRVGARLPGHAASALHELNPDRELRLVLPGPAAALRGSVVDPEGRAVPLARLILYCDQSPRQWPDEAGHTLHRGGDSALQCDADGHFAAEMPPGPVTIEVFADGFAPFQQSLDAALDAPTEVRLQLVRSAPARGRLVDQNGDAVADATVHMFQLEQHQVRTTGADGSFAFTTVPTGALSLFCEHPSIEPIESVRAADANGPCMLVAQRRPTYPMRFLDVHGGPVRCDVRCADIDVEPVATDAGGRIVVIASVTQPTALELCFRSQHLRLDWPAGAQPGIETTVVVPTGTDRMASVHGQLAEADGTPLPSARLWFAAIDGDNAARAFVEDGAFESEVFPDHYRLLVERGDGSPRVSFPLDVLTAGERRDLGTLRMPALGKIALRVLRSDGKPASGVHVFLPEAQDKLPLPNRATQRGGAAIADDHGLSWLSSEPLEWPIGHQTFRIEAIDVLTTLVSFDVTAGRLTTLDLVLPTATWQRVHLPVPKGWEHTPRIDYELLAPDGSVVVRGESTTATGLGEDFPAPLLVGTWQLVLRRPDGQQAVATFTVPDLTPRDEPFVPELTAIR